MRLKGTLRKWDDDKGFGFIAPEAETADVFLHIKSLPRGSRRPVNGDVVSYELGRDDRQRARALSARLETTAFSCSGKTIATGIAVLFLAAISLAAWLGKLPQWVAVGYVVMSALTFAAYASDKWRAKANAGRTPEFTLHLLELCGGWPGALAAQHSFRHKTRKISFQVVFWLIAAAHVGGWIWFFGNAEALSTQLRHFDPRAFLPALQP